MAKGYALYSIQVDKAAWVVLYSNAAALTSDSGRLITVDPAPGAGVIAEAITTGINTVYFTPAAFGFNNEASPNTTIPIKIYNNGVSSTAINVIVTYLPLET
jgi:hypothetical protein